MVLLKELELRYIPIFNILVPLQFLVERVCHNFYEFFCLVSRIKSQPDKKVPIFLQVL